MNSKKGWLKLCILGMFLFCFALSSSTSERYDVLIKGAKIVDGTGKATFQGDIAIKGEKIVAVGKVKGQATAVIDGSKLVACPGFIDPHNHSDGTIEKYPLAENYVMQGITTVHVGNCGGSPAPTKEMTLGEWMSRVEKGGISINIAPMVGHGTLRVLVMGQDYRRKATSAEIEEMKKYAEEAMKDGAFGFSSFGDPSPGNFAPIEELIELAKVVQKYGGIYDPHTRGTQSQWSTDDPEEVSYGISYAPLEDAYIGRYRGLAEAVEVCKKANISLNIAHMSNAFWNPEPKPDFVEEATAKATLIEIIDKPRKEGLDVTFDIMAYDRNISGKRKLIDEFYRRTPALNFVQHIEKEKFVEKLKTREFRDKLRKVDDIGRLKFGMIHTKVDPWWMDRFKILTCKNKDYEGKTIGEISRMMNTDALEAIFDILVEDPKAEWVQFYDPRMHPAAITVLIQHPYGMPCTDTSAGPVEGGRGNPISYGLYPHYIRTYVKEKKVLSLEEAIRKATSLPAQKIGLKDRGIIRPDAYADIVVFSFETIRDKGDFLNPSQRPDGIEYVLVNGKVVYKGMRHTGEKPGKVLRHK